MASAVSRIAMPLLLAVLLVICPYSCMHYPRGADSAEFEKDTGVECSCCCNTRTPTAPELPQPSPTRGKPCSCLCICKGALSEFPGQVSVADLESPDWGPIVLFAAQPPTLLLTDAWADQPESPPPKTPSGREIRALTGVLLL